MPAILLEGRKGKKETATTSSTEDHAAAAAPTDESNPSTAINNENEIEEAMRQMMERIGVNDESHSNEHGDNQHDTSHNGDHDEDIDDTVNPDSLFKLDDTTTVNEEDKPTNEDGPQTASGKIGTSAKLDSLLARLPAMNNRELIDKAAIDFCFLNIKGSRKRLAQVSNDYY